MCLALSCRGLGGASAHCVFKPNIWSRLELLQIIAAVSWKTNPPPLKTPSLQFGLFQGALCFVFHHHAVFCFVIFSAGVIFPQQQYSTLALCVCRLLPFLEINLKTSGFSTCEHRRLFPLIPRLLLLLVEVVLVCMDLQRVCVCVCVCMLLCCCFFVCLCFSVS